MVHSVRLKDGDTQTQSENAQWLNRSALQEAAVSTGVKKVVIMFTLCVCETLLDYRSQKACFYNNTLVYRNSFPDAALLFGASFLMGFIKVSENMKDSCGWPLSCFMCSLCKQS